MRLRSTFPAFLATSLLGLLATSTASADTPSGTGISPTLARGSENNRFFRAIVELSHAMGLEVVAKGIEAGATLDCARILGCTYGQGDWVRPPMPVPDLSPAFDIGARHPRH